MQHARICARQLGHINVAYLAALRSCRARHSVARRVAGVSSERKGEGVPEQLTHSVMQFSRSVSSFWASLFFFLYFASGWHCTHFWRFFLCCQFMRTYARARTHTHSYTCVCVCESFYTWFYWRSVDQINFMARSHFSFLLCVCLICVCVYMCVCLGVCLCCVRERDAVGVIVLLPAGQAVDQLRTIKISFVTPYFYCPSSCALSLPGSIPFSPFYFYLSFDFSNVNCQGYENGHGYGYGHGQKHRLTGHT